MRVNGSVFRNWEGRRRTVNCTTGGSEHNLLHVVGAGGFCQADGGEDIGLRIEKRGRNRLPHIDLGCQVEHDLGGVLVEKLIQINFQQVSLNERNPCRDVLPLAVGQVIHHDRLMPLSHQQFHKMGTNKSGSASNKCSHIVKL